MSTDIKGAANVHQHATDKIRFIDDLSIDCVWQKKSPYLDLVPIGTVVKWKICILEIKIHRIATDKFLRVGGILAL